MEEGEGGGNGVSVNSRLEGLAEHGARRSKWYVMRLSPMPPGYSLQRTTTVRQAPGMQRSMLVSLTHELVHQVMVTEHESYILLGLKHRT